MITAHQRPGIIVARTMHAHYFFYNFCYMPITFLFGCFNSIDLFFSRSYALVNYLFAELSVGGKTWRAAVEKHAVSLTFTLAVFYSLLFLILSLPSDHLKSSIPFFPSSLFCPFFIAHTGNSDWFTAGPVSALWRFLPFLHFVAFAEMVICHCACAARHEALHRLVREQERASLLILLRVNIITSSIKFASF